MEKFEALRALACPLGLENVDTDQLIPARFMSRSRAQGYGGYLLHDLRFDESGAPRGHLIDAPVYAGAKIIVARRNFGTGSSREAAVYALADYGIRCVIAPSFGDIFSSNATKNGVLTATVSPADAEAMLQQLTAMPAAEFTINLPEQTIRCGNHVWLFVIDPVRKMQLINGWDDIDMTRQYQPQIRDFHKSRKKDAPWATPVA